MLGFLHDREGYEESYSAKAGDKRRAGNFERDVGSGKAIGAENV
jgi:hypothetical protein